MCEPASFIVTKDRVFWSKRTDGHEGIIEEHGLHADGIGGPNIVRVEINPPNGDMTKPLTEWRYKLDQDVMPEWYDAEDCERRARVALTEWAAQKLITADRDELRDGEFYVFGTATVEARGSATVKALDNATVKAWGNATVKAWGNATVKAWGNATVEAWGSATVKALDNATVKAWGNATVKAWDNATVKALDNATVKAWDNATVKAWDNATVIAYISADKHKLLSASAVLVDRSVNPPVCYVGMQKP